LGENGEYAVLLLQYLNISNLLSYTFGEKTLDATLHLKVIAFCFAAKIMVFQNFAVGTT
jgi:hypothetical protein